MSRPDETTTQPPVNTGDESVPQSSPSAAPLNGPSKAAPYLMGVKLPIRVLLGRTQLSLREITQLVNGTVVELDCSPDDPVQIMVNDRVIAQGEVVLVGENYGIRITRIGRRDDPSEAEKQANDLLSFSEKLR